MTTRPSSPTAGKCAPPNTSVSVAPACPGRCTAADRAVAERFATHRIVSVGVRRRNARIDSLSHSSATKSPVPNALWRRRTLSMPCTQCSSDVDCSSCASTLT
ncbi:Uncharacterised protein [Mycobacteroides abscessus]|nr:Uncharacterised protein [Mycobacteroides abscessus]